MADRTVDLADLRGDDPRSRPEGPGKVTPSYVNDAQATVESDGTVTLTFAYQGSGGSGDAVAFTMPAGLYLELCTQGFRIAADAAERGVRHGTNIAQYLAGAQRKATGAEPEGERRGGPPTPLRPEAGS